MGIRGSYMYGMFVVVVVIAVAVAVAVVVVVDSVGRGGDVLVGVVM